MNTETAAGSLDKKLADALQALLSSSIGKYRLMKFKHELAARNLKIVEMKDGE